MQMATTPLRVLIWWESGVVSVGVIWHIQLSMPFLFVMVQLCFCNKGKDLPDAARKNGGTRKKPLMGTDDGVERSSTWVMVYLVSNLLLRWSLNRLVTILLHNTVHSMDCIATLFICSYIYVHSDSAFT